MKIWKNTATLDEYFDFEPFLVTPENAEYIIVGSKKFDLKELPNLKAVFKCGIGTDNLPFEEAKRKGVEIVMPSTETIDVIFEETANFAVGQIIAALFKDVGDLEKWKKFQRTMLGNKNVLLIGQGNIGKKVKNKLEDLVIISTFDKMKNNESELIRLISDADVISIHIPLSADTENWWDKSKLSHMKDGSTLVNTSRGKVVNEIDLLEEIVNKRIFARFDVFWEEPYYGELRKFHPQRFFMTPHVASTCKEFLEGLAKDFSDYIFEKTSVRL